MSILDELREENTWTNYREAKLERNQLNKRELRQLDDFIMNKKYESVTDTFSFGLPVKKTISKMDSDKKRTVYSYSTEETWVLKVMAYLLYRYDHLIPECCYSFRRNITAAKAISNIRKIRDLNEKYVLKADVHDYFNSIDCDFLTDVLREIITDDDKLLEFMISLLKQDKCVFEGKIIYEKRGAMAGVPLASFFANVYLMSMDKYFTDKSINYYRYSDDIIMFLDSEEELDECLNDLKKQLNEKKLTLNDKKTRTYKPQESWEFLGFKYNDGEIELSEGAIRKMKGRIRRKAHKLYRWRKKNNADYERAARAMIRSLDNRLYDLSGTNDFTWSRFYFPVITTTEGLHQIDEYMLMYLRYLYTGKHGKSNYKVSYESLKLLGYTPLVAEYYNWKKENEMLEKGRDR